MTEANLDGIAIIGLTGRFPGAANVDEFWRNIAGGVESISTFTDEELSASGFDAAMLRKEPGFIAARGVLEKADCFDAAFFGMNPKEAEVTDPQQRLFLEAAWEALENSGYSSEQFAGLIGVYAGMGNNTYFLNNLHSRPDLVGLVGEMVTMMANEKDFLATRVAYKLNLKGPALNINTACSTSLVAVCQACQSLLNFQCDIALAGAISVNFPQKRGYQFQEGGIVSPDGHCRAFDAQAEGTVAADGLGIVVLKRLAEALNDGDQIYAVIKGTGLNNDGSGKVSFSSPSVAGQAEAIAFAQAQAGFDPSSISYVEAHGTGTPLGDPIEIEGLTQAFGSTPRKNFCALGSVKSNIGHLDTAAGVAGLIKTALALKHKKLPPSLHFTKPNPRIDFENSPFYVNTKLADWPMTSTPRRAGVSSFGLGGTNAHVVLEEAPQLQPSDAGRDWQLLVWSAKTSSALEAATANLLAHLKANPDINLADVAFTLQLGRSAFNHRRMLVCRNIPDAIRALETLDVKRVFTQHLETGAPPVAFMFPGQGAQYVNMGAELYRTEKVFADEVDRCAKMLQSHLGMDLRQIIFPQNQGAKAAEELLVQTRITQPALFVIEYALAQLWMSWGIKPRAMIGHSVGEYVAGCLAGVFTLEEALALVAQRARLVQMQPGGAMLAVRLPEKEVQPLLQDGLSIAAINAANLCVVSGPYESIERLEKQLSERGVAGRRLSTSHAFHSAMMEPVLAPFTEILQKVRLREPGTPYVSNVTARWITAAEATDPKYWAGHVRQTVRFAEGVGELLKDPQMVLLESGPGQTLTTLTRQHPSRGTNQTVIASLTLAKEAQQETNAVLNALGKLWLSGVAVDWAAFHKNEQRRRVALPTYPFERKRFWAEPGNRVSYQTRTSNAEHRTPNIEIAEKKKTEVVERKTPATRKERILAVLLEQLENLSGKAAADIPRTVTFLEMGFDSLFLAQASQAFHKKLGVKITFRQMQENLSTLDEVADYFDRQLSVDVLAGSKQITETPKAAVSVSSASEDRLKAGHQAPISDETVSVFPLSEAQMEIWLATQWGENASRSFNQVVSLNLRGTLNRAALSEALNELVARHDALRTTFLPDGSGQTISRAGKIEITFTDLSSAVNTESDSAIHNPQSPIANLLRAQDETTFDLVHGPLLRAQLVKLAESEHVLLLASHHLVLDGWSISIALRELGQLYSARSRGEKAALKPILQPVDYVKWQTSPENRAASAHAEAYWLKQFASPPTPVELPGDHARPAAQTYLATTESLRLTPEFHQSLKAAAARQGVTVFTYLLASLNVWLHRLGGQEDIALGIPAAGQVAMSSQEGAPDFRSLVGHCVNLLPLRSQCTGTLAFADYLQTVKQLMLDAHEHQNFTYGDLIKRLNLPRDASRVPLLSVMFNVIRLRQDIEFAGLEIEYELTPKGFNIFDLSIDVVDSETELRLDCRFNRDLFESATMQRWLGHWRTLLEAAVDQPTHLIAALPTLSEAERQTMLVDWNNTDAAFPQEDCVPQLFEKRARENPKAIAVKFENQQLSYEELNARANRLAHYLKQQGVGAETLVAVCVERSLELVVGLLAILKAGGAYVPLDPNYPAERLEFILQDSKAAVLLTQKTLAQRLPNAARESSVKTIYLDPQLSTIGPQSEIDLAPQATQKNLAYVLYTSGSTGKPKGVQIGHRALVNFLASMQREPGLKASDILLAVTTLSFDIAGLELWLPLTTGAQVVIAPSDIVREGKQLAVLLEQCGATVMQATPATWRMLLEAGWQGNSRLKALCGGEAWGEDLAKALLPKCSSLWNMYGPTETTIWSAATRVNAGETPFVGAPIANTQFYVLDARMQPAPIGVAGELHIGGDGLARGYLNRLELTAEKFVADPFSAKAGGRLYKTGDLVRYRGRGKIEFLGRMDFQVKIRGFRIELGEIENALRRHPSVREAVVSARDGQVGAKRLVAYLVGQNLSESELRDFLRKALPEYMIPSAFVVMSALPLTPNGKVDRKSLPEPAENTEVQNFVAPATPAEMAVAAIWCEVLDVKQVGRDDNFFMLGGHSLLATRLISRFEKLHQAQFKLREIFDSPTVFGMAQLLERKQAKVNGSTASAASLATRGNEHSAHSNLVSA